MKKKELIFSITIDDFDVSYFSTGKGGQNINRHMKMVRMKHPPSGATGIGKRHRSLKQNTRDAFNNLVKSKKFQYWIKIEASKRSEWYIEMQKKIEAEVDRAMDEKNLKIEIYRNGNWVECTNS